MAATLSRTLRLAVAVPAGFGLATCFHLVPFQRKTRVLDGVPPLYPTAQTWVREEAATSSSTPPGTGVGTRFHAVPFQCKAPSSPTAQMLAAETAATPYRMPLCLGTATTFHPVPSQC